MQQSVLHKALYAFIWGRSTLCNRLFDSMYSLVVKELGMVQTILLLIMVFFIVFK